MQWLKNNKKTAWWIFVLLVMAVFTAGLVYAKITSTFIFSTPGIS